VSIALPLVHRGFCICRSRALTSLNGIAPAMWSSASSALTFFRATPDHEGELGLIVDVLRVRGRQDDVLAAAAERVRELGEPHWGGRDLLAGLFGVVAVVETEADDLLGIGDRGVQGHIGEWDALVGFCGAYLELAQPVPVEYLQQSTHGRGGYLERRYRDQVAPICTAAAGPSSVWKLTRRIARSAYPARAPPIRHPPASPSHPRANPDLSSPRVRANRVGDVRQPR